jgi:hypothetical protein
VNVTLTPEQIEVELADMLKLGVTEVVTVIVTVFEVAVLDD